ncbi:54S ribosomal protein L8, mitochondrial [Hypoxylon texense]
MGFTTGFTGGVTLTLSIAYLTVLSHQRHREHQAAILRQQTRALSSLVDPLPPPLPPTRSEAAAAARETLVERAKDRWNAEVEGAVRWAQAKDWDEVREGLETAVGRLWARAFGESSLEEAGRGEARVRDVAGEAKTSVAAAAKGAYADAKAKGSEAAAKAGEKAGEAKGSIFGSIGSIFGRGKEAAGQAVGIAEKKVDELPSTASAEEKALAQRYKGSPSLNQSPEEVLAARYQGSNTQLKA